MLFGQNLFDLVPESDPAQAWFRQRVGLPDYETMTIAPPTETFADHFAFHLPNDTMHLNYWGRRIATAILSCLWRKAGSFSSATSCSTAGFPGSATATCRV